MRRFGRRGLDERQCDAAPCLEFEPTGVMIFREMSCELGCCENSVPLNKCFADICAASAILCCVLVMNSLIEYAHGSKLN